MGLFRPPRNAAVRTAEFERLIATAPSPRFAYSLAKGWIDHEVKHLDADEATKREIRLRLDLAERLTPARGTPGYEERLAALTADIAMWAADLAQRNGA